MHCNPLRKKNGYTLIEVMIGMSILSLAVGAASVLSMTAAQIEQRNSVMGRGFALVEAAHNLYQLGLAPADAIALLPADPNVVWSAPAASGITAASLESGGVSVASTERVSFTATIADPPGDVATARTVTVESVREHPWFR